MTLKETGEPASNSKNGNRLIDGLPRMEREAVLAQCERVELAPGTVLCEAGEPFKHAYFPLTGNISLVKTIPGHDPFETESIGNEGMLGTALILGVNCAPQRGIVQTPCLALQMITGEMKAALHRHPALGRILQRYLYVVLAELSQTAGCIRFHDVGNRLARGLLLAQDRLPTDYLPFTHQFLADMLGVQRGAVTIAAMKLQRQGIIRYSRGKISILDRGGLEAASCGCYGASIENYTTILS